MNRILLPLILLAIASLQSSCSEHTHDAAAHDDHTAAAPDSTPATVHDALPSVKLDNGQRWKANPETTTGIANMVGILDTYDPSSGDPKDLKAALDDEFKLIFERCTMTGESHEQLHNYLIPIHHALADLDGGREADRDTIAALLTRYADYFE